MTEPEDAQEPRRPQRGLDDVADAVEPFQPSLANAAIVDAVGGVLHDHAPDQPGLLRRVCDVLDALRALPRPLRAEAVGLLSVGDSGAGIGDMRARVLEILEAASTAGGRATFEPAELRWLIGLIRTSAERCARCGEPVKHGVFYAAGFWGYICDPANGGRDLTAALISRVYDIAQGQPPPS